MKSFWATFIDIWRFLSGHTAHSLIVIEHCNISIKSDLFVAASATPTTTIGRSPQATRGIISRKGCGELGARFDVTRRRFETEVVLRRVGEPERLEVGRIERGPVVR